MIAEIVSRPGRNAAGRWSRPLAIAALAVVVAACQPAVNRTPPGTTAPTATTPEPIPSGPPQRIGLLVPLTGNAASVGQDLASAAQMALIERGNDRLEVLPRDTESTQDGAVAAARQLLDQENVDVLLGPLFGSSAEQVARFARERGVVVLSFSSQGNIAGNGLFVLGFRPEEQVERVAGFALSRGYERVAALAPDDSYGQTAVASLRGVLQARTGGQLVGVQFYARDASDLTAKIEALRAAGGGRAGDLPAFDALLLADGGQRLRAVAAQLPDHDITPVDVRMLGTMLWPDDAATLQEPALRGGWYAGVADAATRDFRSRFRRTFGRDPHPLAILGYDGFLIAADAASDRATATQRITDARGYQGEAGIIRLRPSGIADHGLAVFELTAGGPVVVDPAPVRFVEPTS